MYTTSPNGTSFSTTSPTLHSWIHYGWVYHVLGLVYKCLDMKNNFSSSCVSPSLCGFQLQTLGKFVTCETSLIEVALWQQYLALWVMAGFFRRVQVRRLGAQFLLCLVNGLLLAHQHLWCHWCPVQALPNCQQLERNNSLMAQSFLFL